MKIFSKYLSLIGLLAFILTGISITCGFTSYFDVDFFEHERQALHEGAQQERDRRESSRLNDKENKGKELNEREQRSRAEIEARSLERNP
jgi:hypothetical protein